MPEVTGSSKEVEKAGAVDSTESVKPTDEPHPENDVSSTSPEKKSPEKSEAESLLAQGRRHLFVKDYPNAVASLGEACAKLSEMYGDLADNCADAYFSYGRALLELAREESNILGTDPEKAESEDGDEDEQDEDEEKPHENGEAEAKPQEVGEKVEEESKNKDEKESSDEVSGTAKEASEENNAPDGGEENEEDVDNLQLAWEVLELAKKIYERQEAHVKLAETYLYLGEIGLESENYSGAIEDMKRCVEIQKNILPSDHREIAETYFQMGVACSLCNEFDDATSNFKTSSEILETRIKNLEKNGASDVDTEKNPFYSVEKEITEIKALLPEIKAKISDMEEAKQETIRSVMASLKDQPESKDGAGPSSAATSSSSAPFSNGTSSKPASDISHLIRKKRKPEDDSPSDKTLKKPCTTEANK